MKKQLSRTICLLLFSLNFFSGVNAQVITLLSDDFESYPGYQVCPGYTTDIQVYPTHGTNSSKGLRAFMNSFDSHDSLVTDWISPISSVLFRFDFRIMEASALYPFIPATLNAGDLFSLLYTTDNQQWVVLQNWTSGNFTPVTTFTPATIPVPDCDSAKFKFVVSRVNNPIDYFVDIDNLDISRYLVGLNEPQVVSEIMVYPNRFTQQFIIELKEKGSRGFQLTDLQGKSIIEGELSEGINTINTTTIPTGIYLLRIKDTQHTDVYRMMKVN